MLRLGLATPYLSGCRERRCSPAPRTAIRASRQEGLGGQDRACGQNLPDAATRLTLQGAGGIKASGASSGCMWRAGVGIHTELGMCCTSESPPWPPNRTLKEADDGERFDWPVSLSCALQP